MARSEVQLIPPEAPGAARCILPILVVAVLAGIPFALGKYFELNQPDPYDSASNVYSAQRILDGARIGVDERPSADCGTLFLNVAGVWLMGYSEMGPKLIQGLFQVAALLAMFVALRRAMGMLAAGVAVVVASIYLSAPLIAKFGNVKEQFMIACMVMGASFLILRQLGGRWWWAVLSGATIVWAPLFKATGVSVIAAAGLFLLAQPLWKHRTWRQTGADILLMLGGAALGMLPLCAWLAAMEPPINYWPYFFVWGRFVVESAKGGSAYVAQSRQLISSEELTYRVLRYYSKLILPIAMAAAALLARLVRGVLQRVGPWKGKLGRPFDRFVPLLAIWWLLDMAFVWISPHSYEQYYLPLNASAAMLGAYAAALLADSWRRAEGAAKLTRAAVGAAGLAAMIVLVWPIFFGIRYSPHSGDRYPQPSRGYLQRYEEIRQRTERGARGAWEVVGQHIRENSQPSDRIYVWGWYPGIYLAAGRISPAPKAFEANMHFLSPQELSRRVAELLAAFAKEPPKFIVDTRKSHFPFNRPPLELWPSKGNMLQVIQIAAARKGLLAANGQLTEDVVRETIDGWDWLAPGVRHQVARMLLEDVPPGDIVSDPASLALFEQVYPMALGRAFDKAEAERFAAMKPFRQYVMSNYEIVGKAGGHVVFQRKAGRP